MGSGNLPLTRKPLCVISANSSLSVKFLSLLLLVENCILVPKIIFKALEKTKGKREEEEEDEEED
jgi:hypothetical protein